MWADGGGAQVPLTRFVANLSEMITMVTNPTSPWYSPKTRIILITPPPLEPTAWAAHCASRDPPGELDRHQNVVIEYAEAVIQVGKAQSVPVIDLWTTLWVKAGRKEEGLAPYLSDGLHLNAEGYGVRVFTTAFLRAGKTDPWICSRCYTRSSKTRSKSIIRNCTINGSQRSTRSECRRVSA